MWFPSALALLMLQQASTSKSQSASFIYGPEHLSFALSPTALLHESHSHKKTRSLHQRNHVNANADANARVAAVYAGLDYIHHADLEENLNENSHARRLVDEHNAIIDDFNLQRRYSRFEHERRKRRELETEIEIAGRDGNKNRNKRERHLRNRPPVPNPDDEVYSKSSGAGHGSNPNSNGMYYDPGAPPADMHDGPYYPGPTGTHDDDYYSNLSSRSNDDDPTGPGHESEDEDDDAIVDDKEDDDVDGEEDDYKAEYDEDDDEVTTMNGGTYDAYQTVPLSQGYGTHYVTAWVGTPNPQPQTLIVDTGSHHTAFPCYPCQNCGQQYHADEFFNPDSSESFKTLGCSECTGNASCDGKACAMSQSYSEGSSWHAFQAVDMFVCSKNHPKELEVTAEELYPYMDDEDLEVLKHEKKFYDLDQLDLDYGFPFVFGCQTSVTGLFRTQLADGIMGMSAVEDIYPNQMYKNNLLDHNMFSICFKREAMRNESNKIGGDKEPITAGILTLGGVDRRIERSPMVYAKDIRESKMSDWYTVNVKQLLLIGGGIQHANIPKKNGMEIYTISKNEKILNNGKGVIVDSGTTDTYFQKVFKSQFEKGWNFMTGKKYSNTAMEFTHDEVMKLPTVFVVMEAVEEMGDDSEQWENPDEVFGLAGSILSPDSPRDILLAIPATHYMEYSPSSGKYTPRLYFTESSGGLLGANAMMNHDVLFDMSGRIGFSESNCDYDALLEAIDVMPEIEVDENGDGASKDCVLGPASISSTCYENLSYARCEKTKDPELMLKGVEVWSMVVEEEGFGDGKECKDVASDRFATRKSLRSGCEATGVCEVMTTCSMTCKEFEEKVMGVGKEEEKKDEDKNGEVDEDKNDGEDEDNAPSDSVTNTPGTIVGEDNDDCPNFGWGSCIYSCEQSKITSHLLQDGQCHTADIETRPCHIDACGRSDPCRVPFIVHAIILFADSDPAQWTKTDEDLFAEGFADAVNKEQTAGEELFGPGDVKVISVGPWKEDDDFFDEEDLDHGMQVAVEISMYNEHAILPKDLEDQKNSTDGILRKGKDIFHVITGPGLAKCKESDVYQLSRQALSVHVELGKGTFMYDLIESIREKESNHLRQSVFEPLFSDDESVENSSVLTSWTIKTEVGGFFQDGNFQGISKETIKHNVPETLAIILVLFCFCYCGVCCGTFLTRRKYELLNVKRNLQERIRQRKENKERGKYTQVGVDQGNEDSSMDFVDDFQDNPVDDFEDIDAADASEKIETERLDRFRSQLKTLD